MQNNPEVSRAAKKRYKERHKEKVQQQERERIKRKRENGWTPTPEQREAARQRANLWYRNNLDRHKACSRAYRKSEKGRLLKKVYGNRYRTKKLTNHNVPYSEKELASLRAKFDNRCAYCGCNDAIAIDHFIPISKGGADVFGNLIPACTSCNSSKKSSDAKAWYEAQLFYSKTRWKKIVQHLGIEVINGQLPLF